MGFSVHADITPRAAARLLLSGEMDLTGVWPLAPVLKIFDELRTLSVEEILSIIDCNPYGQVAEVRHIPQFGTLGTLLRVPGYFAQAGRSQADYPQLGFYLKQDVTANLAANTKFGETYGKAAALAGIVCCANCRITPSALSEPFCSLERSQQQDVLTRLLFRIPVVQIILRQAALAPVNGYDAMAQLSLKTRARRGQCLRNIFRLFRAYGSGPLNARMDRVFWEEREDIRDAEI